MDDGEVMQRVIGILTRARELAEEAAGEVDERSQGEEDIVGALMQDVVGVSIDVPEGATPREVGVVVSDSLRPALMRLVGCFSVAFL